MSTINLFINGSAVTADGEDAELLLIDFLHERSALTGTRFCCGIGVCGACTVAVRGNANEPLRKLPACTTPLAGLQGMQVFTVESLDQNGQLNELQQALLDNFAFQCGYCTPGFLMSATVMLEHLQQSPVSEAELDELIRNWIGSNLCRCTGYVRYLDAIRSVALRHVTRTERE